MGKKARAVAKFLRENPPLLKREKTTHYEVSETSMDRFLYIDPSSPYLVNPAPKHFIRKVRHLWVIK